MRDRVKELEELFAVDAEARRIAQERHRDDLLRIHKSLLAQAPREEIIDQVESLLEELPGL